MLAAQEFLFDLNPQLLFDAALLAIAVFFLYMLMSYLLFNPARKLLKDRQDHISSELDEASADKEKAAALKAEYEAKLKEIDKEAETILADARQKALKNQNRIVNEAKEEAAQILETAQSQAAQIHEQAVNEAEQLREQARQDGYRDGHETATQEAMQQKQIQDDAYASKEQELQNRYEETLANLEPQLLDTILKVFDEVFTMQFCGKREMLLQLVRHAMRGIRETKYYKIRVCESEVDFLREHKRELQEKVGDDVTIEIVMDPGLTESQCVIDADSGVYDCSLDVELDNLTRDLKSLAIG